MGTVHRARHLVSWCWIDPDYPARISHRDQVFSTGHNLKPLFLLSQPIGTEIASLIAECPWPMAGRDLGHQSAERKDVNHPTIATLGDIHSAETPEQIALVRKVGRLVDCLDSVGAAAGLGMTAAHEEASQFALTAASDAERLNHADKAMYKIKRGRADLAARRAIA